MPKLFETDLNHGFATMYYHTGKERWEAKLYNGKLRHSQDAFALEDRVYELWSNDYEFEGKDNPDSAPVEEQAPPPPFEPIQVVAFSGGDPFVGTILSPQVNSNGVMVDWSESPLPPAKDVRKKGRYGWSKGSVTTSKRYQLHELAPYKESDLDYLKSVRKTRAELAEQIEEARRATKQVGDEIGDRLNPVRRQAEEMRLSLSFNQEEDK